VKEPAGQSGGGPAIQENDPGRPGQKLRVGRVFRRGWESPTLMSWASIGSQFLSFVLVLPLIVTRLPEADVALWFLFVLLIQLQTLADMGFTPTFVRVIAYAMGGAGLHQLRDYRDAPLRPEGQRAPDWCGVDQICATIRVVNNRLTLVATAGLLTVGTLAVLRPVSASPDPSSAWMAWGVIVLGSALSLRGQYFIAYLQGVDQIAVMRRWQAITNLCAVGVKIAVLLAGGGLLALVVVNQSWMVLNIGRNWWLCRTVHGGRFRSFQARGIHPDVFGAVWPSAWRSGLGALFGEAPARFTGVLFAQIGTPGGVATYLLALKILTTLRSFSLAPFTSKVPALSRLRAEGRIPEQIRHAQRGMRISHWTYAAGFVGIGLSGPALLKMIGSNVDFPDPLLWGLLGLAVFVDRFSMMHLHLYGTTNHITWHVVHGVSAAVFAVLAAFLLGWMGVYAFPLAYLVAYLSYPVVHSTRRSYSTLSVRFWSFERSVLIVPALVVLVFTVVTIASWVAHG
jgi:O-antigen/teichoic acid export membrane protein